MFSVVVPVYNHAPYLGPCVLSALRSAQVTEILLVDDGSRDGSGELIEALGRAHPRRVRALEDPGNRGAAARLNQLVRESREEWVAVLNSDDAFTPGRFEVVRRRCRHAEASFVCGHLLVMDAEGRARGTKRGVLQPEYPFPAALDPAVKAARGELLDLLAHQNFVATTSNMVFHRSLFERIGGFRDHRYVHDWDFALRAAAEGSCLYLPHYLAIYRSHGSNTIRTDVSEIRAEVRQVFTDFLHDYPALRGRRDFAIALAGNRYLH